MTDKRQVRADLTTAALALFHSQGYEQTTVDEIAEAAGVARRTFFRYFRTKDDAVFPDHDACLTRVRELLAGADPGTPPMAVFRSAAHLVLSMYADDPATAVRRYALTRRVPQLRGRETAATSGYQRTFTAYLRAHAPGGDPLRAEVAGAAVVTAHNHVLREWLRGGGTGDVHQRLDTAFDTLDGVLTPWLTGAPAAPDDDVVVVAVRRGAPMWRVVQQIEAATTIGPT